MKSLIALFFCALFLTGCATSHKSISTSGVNIDSYSSADFNTELLGPVTGGADIATILYTIPIQLPFYNFGSYSPFIMNFYDFAKERATYEAIESAPSADGIIAPRINAETLDFFGLVQFSTVTVKGQAVKYSKK